MSPRVTSVLSRADKTSVVHAPYPHLYIENAIGADCCQALNEAFFLSNVILKKGISQQNHGVAYSGVNIIEDPQSFPAVWVDFMRYHLSAAFFQDFWRIMREPFRAMYPDFEDRLGKRLEDATVIPRPLNPAARAASTEIDIQLDCQLGVNTPVTQISSVRGPHIDGNLKLFNALLYLRMPGDTSTGGEFEIYRANQKITYGSRGDKYGVQDNGLELVKRIPYQTNSFVLFVNSLSSVHGVSPRSVTPYPRQYINFLAEARIPVFPFDGK